MCHSKQKVVKLVRPRCDAMFSSAKWMHACQLCNSHNGVMDDKRVGRNRSSAYETFATLQEVELLDVLMHDAVGPQCSCYVSNPNI